MLEVVGRNRDEVGDTQRQYTPTGTVDTGTREIEMPGDAWRKGELGVLDPDSDSLWTGWKVVLCEKLCAR